MNSILDEIVASKLNEVAVSKELRPVGSLKESRLFNRTCNSISKSLKVADSGGVIAEFKRQSPSKGGINITANVAIITKAYVDAGSAAISVLTDEHFFGAHPDDFLIARSTNPNIPLLRKDFMVDEYQIMESKAMGADVILLIAKILSPIQIERYTSLAHALGMQVLLEVQDITEILKNSNTSADIVGVNNRNLNNFTIDLNNSQELVEQIPKQKLKIAESGISKLDDVLKLKQAGFQGFLIGSLFMQEADPGLACKSLINAIRYAS